jgi:hypothetical protein
MLGDRFIATGSGYLITHGLLVSEMVVDLRERFEIQKMAGKDATLGAGAASQKSSFSRCE